MPIVTISKAAKLAGISRQKLYLNYINNGILSIQRNAKGKPQIDTSEIIRVFGELKGDTDIHTKTPVGQENYSPQTQSLLLEIERLKAENAGLKELSEERKNRIEEQSLRISTLESRFDRLLEEKSPEKTKPTLWQRVKSIKL